MNTPQSGERPSGSANAHSPSRSGTTPRRPASLSQKTSIVVLARILTTFIDLAIVIVTIRILTKTEFAIIGYMLMVHELARNLATLGFPESVFYYFEQIAGNRKRGFVLQTTVLLAGTGLAAGMLILGLGQALPALLAEWDPASVRTLMELLPLMGLVTFLEIPTWPATNILLASDRQREAAWFETLTSLATFTAIVLPLSLGLDLRYAVYGLLGYSVFRLALASLWVYRVLPASPSRHARADLPLLQRLFPPSGVPLRRQIGFSLPIGLSSYVNKLNRNIDKLIVSILLPATALAEYNIGAQEVPIIRVIPFAVGSVLISRFVSLQLSEQREELLRLWYKGVEKVSLLVVPLAVLSILAAPDLVEWIATTDNADYRNAVLPFQLYNAIVLIRVTHYGSLLQAFGDSRGVLWMSFNLMLANLVLSIPFTLWLGITGTALATLLANVYNWLVYLHRIGRHMDLPAWKVLPFPHYLRVLGSALASALAAGWVRNVPLESLGPVAGLAISAVLFLLAFCLLGTLVRAIRREDWATVRQAVTLRLFSSSER